MTADKEQRSLLANLSSYYGSSSKPTAPKTGGSTSIRAHKTMASRKLKYGKGAQSIAADAQPNAGGN